MTYPNLTNFRARYEDGSYATDLVGPVDNLILLAGVAKSYTIPTGAKKLKLSYDAGGGVWVKNAAGAAIPVADDTADGLGMRLQPNFLYITSETVISFICSTSMIVVIEPFLS